MAVGVLPRRVHFNLMLPILVLVCSWDQKGAVLFFLVQDTLKFLVLSRFKPPKSGTVFIFIAPDILTA